MAEAAARQQKTEMLARLDDGKLLKKTQTGTVVKPAMFKKDLTFISLVLRYAKNMEKVIDELSEFPSFRGEA